MCTMTSARPPTWTRGSMPSALTARARTRPADGYIVVVVNADVNVATASTFTRTKKIEKLLISKL
jgi:hypothetical protein